VPAGAPLNVIGAERGWILLLILAVWSYDTGAFLVGKNFGRTKFLTHISPSKTIEGLVGGVAASTVVVALRLSARHPHDRWVSALLVGHWAWSALAYHAAFFTRINPAAWLFAAVFLGQAVLVFRVGVVQRRLSFAPWGSAWAPLAWGLIVYSLAYPAINAFDHRSLLRIPTFGLPCPTTILTAGVLMLATPRCWSLSVVPVIWAAVGGSATFLLGVYADVALPIAGIALAIFSVRRTTSEQLRDGPAVPG
jgi:hypothetical protein